MSQVTITTSELGVVFWGIMILIGMLTTVDVVERWALSLVKKEQPTNGQR